MTAQIGDRISYDGKWYTLLINPLEMLFDQGHPRPSFLHTSSDCLRGYVAYWRIHDKLLELLDVCSEQSIARPSTTTSLSRVVDQTEQLQLGPTLTEIFPQQQPPIAATWYTGLLEIPLGQCVEYVHLGYQSTYEQHMYLHVYLGRLVYREIRNSSDWSRCECEVFDRPEGVSSDEEWAFFRAMSQADDYTPHLLYADWLDEHGRDNLATAVRQTVALRQRSKTNSGWLAGAIEVYRLWKRLNHSLVFALTNGPSSREIKSLDESDQPQQIECLVIRGLDEWRCDLQRNDPQRRGQSHHGQQPTSEG